MARGGHCERHRLSCRSSSWSRWSALRARSSARSISLLVTLRNTHKAAFLGIDPLRSRHAPERSLHPAQRHACARGPRDASAYRAVELAPRCATPISITKLQRIFLVHLGPLLRLGRYATWCWGRCRRSSTADLGLRMLVVWRLGSLDAAGTRCSGRLGACALAWHFAPVEHSGWFYNYWSGDARSDAKRIASTCTRSATERKCSNARGALAAVSSLCALHFNTGPESWTHWCAQFGTRAQTCADRGAADRFCSIYAPPFNTKLSQSHQRHDLGSESDHRCGGTLSGKFSLNFDGVQIAGTTTTSQLGSGCHAVVMPSAEQADAFILGCAGLKPTHQGRVRIGSQDPYLTPKLRAQIVSLLAQELEPQLWSQRSKCSELFAYLLNIQATTWRDAQRRSSLLTQLARFNDRPIQSLNNDERRIIMLEFALAHPSPQLALLYEPWSAIQAPTAEAPERRMLSELSRLVQAGSIVVLVTVSEHQAKRYSEKLVHPKTVKVKSSKFSAFFRGVS